MIAAAQSAICPLLRRCDRISIPPYMAAALSLDLGESDISSDDIKYRAQIQASQKTQVDMTNVE